MSAPSLLAANDQWAAHITHAHSDFFPNLAKGQKPHTLWIGCSDSRVPETVITSSTLGNLFVHRNIANQFHNDDTNILAVLKYAVEELKVQHVVIVGHSQCGGVKASLKAAIEKQKPQAASNDVGDNPIVRWLTPLTQLAVELQLSDTSEKSQDILVRASVKKQVENLRKTDTIVKAGKDVQVHGWLFALGTGKLEDLKV